MARFVRTYEFADLDALMALSTDDIFGKTPPIPPEYQGLVAMVGLRASIFRASRRFGLVAARDKNVLRWFGQPPSLPSR